MADPNEPTNVRLSQSTVGWITGGIVIGCIVFILTIALGLHYLRKKYSGKFLATNIQTSHVYGTTDMRCYGQGSPDMKTYGPSSPDVKRHMYGAPDTDEKGGYAMKSYPMYAGGGTVV